MKIKFNELFKRTCSTVLAVACFMSSASFLPIEKFVVSAAQDITFYFRHNVSGEDITTGPAYILEGVPVYVHDNLTEYSAANNGVFTYNAESPFNLSFTLNNGATVPTVDDISQYLIMQAKSESKDAYVQPLLGFTESGPNYATSPGNIEFIVDPVVQYTLDRTATYSSTFHYRSQSWKWADLSKKELTDIESLYQEVNATLKRSDGTSDVNIELTTPNNSLEFEYIGDGITNSERQESEYGDSMVYTQTYPGWGSSAKDWKLTNSSGFFDGYVLTEVSAGSNTTTTPSNEMNKMLFTLTNDNETSYKNIIVEVTFTSLENVAKIYKDTTKFSLNFSYKTNDDRLSFQVKDRQVAVNEISETIFDNPTSYANVTAPKYSTSSNDSVYLQNNHRPFIHSSNYTLNGENDLVLSEIQEGFYLKTRHSDYNYTNGFYIEWEWVPDGLRPVGELSEQPNKQDIIDQYTDGFVEGTDGYKEKEEEALKKYDELMLAWLSEEESYLADLDYNKDLYNVVSIPDFGIENVGTEEAPKYQWVNNTTTSYHTNGRMKADVKSRTDDTAGHLVATVHIFADENFAVGKAPAGSSAVAAAKYDGVGHSVPITSQNSVKIPIIILGTGVKPTFYITDAIMATYSDEKKEYTKEGAFFEYPEGEQLTFPVFKDSVEVAIGTSGSMNMDLNNGVDGINTPPAEIPVGYDPPIPAAPHTVKGSIDFGSGIEKTDRLVITNTTTASSEASILMQYHKSSNNTQVISEYHFTEFGETWEIPINNNDFDSEDNSYVYDFTIMAKGEGLFNMQLDFYNADSSTYPRTTLNKAIQIGSTLPSKEAYVDKIYLHLVQDVVDENNLTAEEQRVKDVLDSLYSDKSTTTATDNPLRGQIPTDIVHSTDFVYDPSGFYYYEMELPYVISDVMLTPVYQGVAITGGAYNMDVKDPSNAVVHVVTGTGHPAGDYHPTTGEIDLIEARNASVANSTTKWIEVSTLAADNATSQKYYLKLIRQDAESTVVLDDLYVDTTDLLGDFLELELTNSSGTVVEFETDPLGVGFQYYISLPYYYYSQKIPVNITAVSNGDWSKAPTIVSTSGLSSEKSGLFTSLSNLLTNKTTETFLLEYNDLYGAGSNAVGTRYPNKFTVTTYAEGTDEVAEYYLTIYIEAPDKNDDLGVMEVMDPSKDDEVIPFKNGTFYPTKNDYIIEIPYELQKYRFSVMPESDNALAVRLLAPDGSVLGTTTYANPGTPIQFLVDFEELGLTSADLNFTFTVAVQSEDGVWSDQYNHPEGHTPYTILFQRDEPNTNSLLDSLDVLNFEDATPIPEYVFEQVKKDYIFTVPYTTERIIIKPIAAEQDRTTITLNGVDFPDEDPGKDFYLKPGESNTFTIIVTAEDPSYTTTYNLHITRDKPDREARLLNLVVNGSDTMTPALFVPSTFTYDVTIPVGTETYTITPTAVSEHAVIMIDGKVIPSGTATEPYHAVDETVVKEVLVWAQDGETTETYTLNITNHNLIEKSDDAELLDAKFQGVDLAPKFLSNVYDYEIYTKPDTILLQIEPEISKGATVEVSVGSKKLDNIDNIYSTSFFTDTDAIKIVVTSESGNTSKTYQFDVFKNTEDKEGIFKPITSDMVDFVSENPIIVDISEYAVIDASVFNTMKDSYPEKTIVFTGNDYMLRMNGSDIKENIPHTVQYDFGFSFTSPEEKLIQAILDDSEYEEDAELEPIYLYFNDHTPLPARMILTVVLGSSVGNSELYWNYYNAERDRIDYYGYVQSNSKGTITVPLTHLSTYMVTTQEIGASENRTNTGFGSLDQGNNSTGQSDGSIGSEGFGDDLTGGFGSSGDISGDLTTNKPNPQTDIFGFPISTTERGMYEQTIYKWYEEKRDRRKKDDESDNDKIDEC